LLGEACGWQQPCDFAMPEWPQRSAIRLQQSRSAAVIVTPGTVHAITGNAPSSIARSETPTLVPSLTAISLILTFPRGNGLRKVSNLRFDLTFFIWPLWMSSQAACDWLQSTAIKFHTSGFQRQIESSAFTLARLTHREGMLYSFPCSAILAIFTAVLAYNITYLLS